MKGVVDINIFQSTSLFEKFLAFTWLRSRGHILMSPHSINSYLEIKIQNNRNICCSSVTCKVLLNGPQSKLGQLCATRCSVLTLHANRRRAFITFLYMYSPNHSLQYLSIPCNAFIACYNYMF